MKPVRTIVIACAVLGLAVGCADDDDGGTSTGTGTNTGSDGYPEVEGEDPPGREGYCDELRQDVVLERERVADQVARGVRQVEDPTGRHGPGSGEEPAQWNIDQMERTGCAPLPPWTGTWGT
jgi:hypothetical protein